MEGFLPLIALIGTNHVFNLCIYFLQDEYYVAHLNMICLCCHLYFLCFFLLYGIVWYPPFLWREFQIIFSLSVCVYPQSTYICAFAVFFVLYHWVLPRKLCVCVRAHARVCVCVCSDNRETVVRSWKKLRTIVHIPDFRQEALPSEKWSVVKCSFKNLQRR